MQPCIARKRICDRACSTMWGKKIAAFFRLSSIITYEYKHNKPEFNGFWNLRKWDTTFRAEILPKIFGVICDMVEGPVTYTINLSSVFKYYSVDKYVAKRACQNNCWDQKLATFGWCKHSCNAMIDWKN